MFNRLKDNEGKVVDLGCGNNKVVGAIGVDNVLLDGVDIVHDLSVFPYPFSDNSLDTVYCRHVLEHFESEVRNKVIAEIGRILKPGGLVEIRVPHAFSVAAMADPTHKTYYCFRTIFYFTKDISQSYYKDCYHNFKVKTIWANFRLTEKNGMISKLISKIFGWGFNKLFHFSGYNADIAVKFLPFFCVEILWRVEKLNNFVVKLK